MTSLTPQKQNRIHRNSLGDALHRAVLRDPNKDALIFENRHWSYGRLDAAVDRLAAALLAEGLSPGDRLAAYGRNSDAYVLTFLACARAGLVHVPLNYALVGEELLYVLSQSRAAAVIYDPALADLVAAVRPQVTARIYGTFAGGEGLDMLRIAEGEEIWPGPAVDLSDDHLAQLLYTSGTTASPKGAMMTHRSLMAEYVSCLIALDLKREDVVLAALPLYHSAQMHVFLVPSLLIGATVVLIQAPLPEACFQAVERFAITSVFAPPTSWISFLRHEGFDRYNLSSLKKAYYGASIMPVPVLQELRARLPGVGVYNCYGQSEVAPLATVLRPEEHEARPASAGRPVFNVETRIVDLEMRDLPPGSHGEIVHRSPQVMAGYWDKADQTEEAFQGEWFHSGDIGYFDEGGYLYIVDRIKDVINTGGVVVSSREVEDVLFAHPAVSEVAVVGQADPRWIEAITAFVVLRQGCQATAEELVAHARQHLAPFKLPKKVIFVATLPRNTAGKIMKRKLRLQEGEESV